MGTDESEALNPSERILVAAESLFAEKGIRGTSLKEITELAGVNISAVNYYFRSKDALVEAVYGRCFGRLNQERLRLLDEAEAAAGTGELRVEAILHALFEPMVRTWRENRNFILLVGRLQGEPDHDLNSFVETLYSPLVQRFLIASKRALPHVGEPQLFFWFYYLFGGVVYTLTHSQDAIHKHPGQSLLDNPRLFLDELISFGAAGLRSRGPLKIDSLPSPESEPEAVTTSHPNPRIPHRS